MGVYIGLGTQHFQHAAQDAFGQRLLELQADANWPRLRPRRDSFPFSSLFASSSRPISSHLTSPHLAPSSSLLLSVAVLKFLSLLTFSLVLYAAVLLVSRSPSRFDPHAPQLKFGHVL